MNLKSQSIAFTLLAILLKSSILSHTNVEIYAVEQAETAIKDPKNKSGQIIPLPSNPQHVLCIPQDFDFSRVETDKPVVDLLVNFHGSPQNAISSVRQAGLHCVILSVNYRGLSSAYQRPFAQNQELFATTLDEALQVLRGQASFPSDIQWKNLSICSFSAGFGAVREILKNPKNYERIDGMLMLDSLYCGYVGDGSSDVHEGVIHPGLMKDFLRYAQESAEGKKVMVITHCVGPTQGGGTSFVSPSQPAGIFSFWLPRPQRNRSREAFTTHGLLAAKLAFAKQIGNAK